MLAGTTVGVAPLTTPAATTPFAISSFTATLGWRYGAKSIART